jgi:SAM-dependent methyltransferase
MSEHSHHGTGPFDHHAFDSPEIATHTELEGEVFLDLLSRALSVLAAACAESGVRVGRVLDLGCGPGVASCRLAEQFGEATVVAVDGSPAMLERAKARAQRLGVASRVETRLAEFPADLAKLGHADVAWVSMALHHLGNEADALRQIRGLLEPAGLLGLVERADPLRPLVATDFGRPGMWDRLDAAWEAWFSDMRAGLPGATESDDYPAMLRHGGFELVADTIITDVVAAPLDAPARRVTQRYLEGIQERLAGFADAADLGALDLLIDDTADESVIRRDDVGLRATRHLYVARPSER